MRTTDSLEHLAEFHEGIEELITLSEESSYGEVRDDIRSFLDFAVASRTSKVLLLNDREREVITRSLYDCIQFYKVTKPRKVGGKYFRHPFGVLLALLDAGCTSVRDLVVAPYHDVPEELCSFLRQQSGMADEEMVIAKALQDSRAAVYSAYCDAGFHRKRAYFAARDVALSLERVTKRKGALYFTYVGNIFSSDKALIRSLRSARRSKSGDAYNNLEEMTTPRAMIEREDFITYDNIIFARENRTLFDEIKEATHYYGLPENHPLVTDIELEAPAWVKTTIKGILVLYGYRNWCLETGRSDKVIDRIPLAELIKQRSREAINHNCTYHCGGYNGQLTPEMICSIHDEFKQYELDGGFKGVTSSGSGRFDGLFLKFGETSIRGDSRYINSLEHDRVAMTCVLLVCERLAELYMEDKLYFPDGMTSQGLIPQSPIVP